LVEVDVEILLLYDVGFVFVVVFDMFFLVLFFSIFFCFLCFCCFLVLIGFD